MWGACGVLREGVDSNKVVMLGWAGGAGGGGACGVLWEGVDSNMVVMWRGGGEECGGLPTAGGRVVDGVRPV